MPIPTLALILALQTPTPQPPTPTPQPGAGQVRKESPNKKPTWPFTAPFHYYRPYESRSPQDELAKLLRGLDYARAMYLKAEERGQDPVGRPIIADTGFQEVISELVPKLDQMAGYFQWLVRDHVNVSYRRSAYFGALYLPAMKDTLTMLEHAPLEPDRDTRHFAIRMGLPILRRYLALRGPEAQPVPWDPRKPGPEPAHTYTFDAVPYANLLRSPSIEDRILGVGVLAVLVQTRPDEGAEQLRRMRPWLEDMLASEKEDLPKAARALLASLGAANPSTLAGLGEVPEAPAEAKAWMEQALRRLFPDIRLKGGICELYDGEDLQRVAGALAALCEDGSLGFTDSEEVRSGKVERSVYGLRLRAHDVLDEVGLPKGSLVVSINGAPVRKPAEALEVVRKVLAADQKRLSVVYVDGAGSERVLQYVYMK